MVASNTIRLILLASLIWAGTAVDAAQPVARVNAGMVRGFFDDDVAVFKGLPFAAPPVGDLRWRAPRPVEAWADSRDARDFAPACEQSLRPIQPDWYKSMLATIGTSEDCLYLNVWAPAAVPEKPLPVMIYIHGGSYERGTAAEPRLNGRTLVGDDVVVVTLNYRLGLLGRFAHPALSRMQQDEALANYGTLDQIAALHWVQRNIAEFGGDPDNVTIFGHSAGGSSVSLLMVSPLSKGLFHRAIAQGGAVRLDYARHLSKPKITDPTNESMESVGMEFAAHFGIDGDDDEVAKALRALPAQDVVTYQDEQRLSLNGAVVDGKILPVPIPVLFERGLQHDVPFMIGSNSWEWNQIAVASRARQLVIAKNLLRNRTAEDLAIYGNLDVATDDELIAMSRRWFADGLFLTTAHYLAQEMSTVSSPAYLYHYGYVQENLRGQIPGAPHGAEVPFIFGEVVDHPEYQRPRNTALTESDLAMVDLLRGYWVSFARTGDPNGGGRPRWPAHDDANATLYFAEDGEARSEVNLNRETTDSHETRALARRRENLSAELAPPPLN